MSPDDDNQTAEIQAVTADNQTATAEIPAIVGRKRPRVYGPVRTQSPVKAHPPVKGSQAKRKRQPVTGPADAPSAHDPAGHTANRAGQTQDRAGHTQDRAGQTPDRERAGHTPDPAPAERPAQAGSEVGGDAASEVGGDAGTKAGSGVSAARRAVADRLRAVGLPAAPVLSRLERLTRFARRGDSTGGWRPGRARRSGSERRPGKERPPGRDPRWAYMMIVFGAVLTLTAGVVVGASEVLANRYEDSVKKDVLIAPQARAAERPRQDTVVGPLNFLLLGSDKRDGDDGERSDTMIMVHIPVTMDRAYLISIPRDLRAQISAFPATGYGGGREKINGAFQHGGGGTGGVQLLSQTLSDMIGIRFDGAAIVDFDGFQKVVAELGGVRMCVDVRTESRHIGHDKDGNFLPPYTGPELERRNYNSTPVVYEVGCYDFRPWQALDFVRQRKSLPDGDYGRQRHQQQFLRAIVEKAQANGLATKPLALDRFIRAVGNSLTVDVGGLSLDELLYSLRNLRPDRMLGITVPSEPQTINGISYVVELPEAATLFTAIRDDTVNDWAAQHPNWANEL